MSDSHATAAAAHFGRHARAYVESPVHAAGPDLAWLAECAGAHAAGGAILDVGCGGGHASYALAAVAGRVVACDASEAMTAAVRDVAAHRELGNLTTALGAAERLPFADGAFDAVATRYSAHHWEDLAQALREMRRVVKPGGAIFFIDVASPGTPLLDTHLQAVELLRDPTHARDYSVAELTHRFADLGASILDLRSAKIDIEFASWLTRAGTPEETRPTIERLIDRAPVEVRTHFGFDARRNFRLDTVWIAARFP